MSLLTQSSVWKDLTTHAIEIENTSLSQFFLENPLRSEQYTHVFNELSFDFSNNLIHHKTLDFLIALAHHRKLQNKIEALFSGKKVNYTEDKPALHIQLRSNDIQPDEVIQERNRFLDFAEKIRCQEIKGFSGKAFTDIVNIGVGGSSLGPELLNHALRKDNPDLRLHFISSMDGEETYLILKELPLDTTLFIISSKSFTTLDTLCNAEIIKNYFQKNTANLNDYTKNIVAVSANIEAMNRFGILPEMQFKLWDFIGGRYSLWSAVGLSIAIVFGKEVFLDFLAGGSEMDEHFKNTSFQKNIPVLLGLLDVWYTNFLNYSSLAILPYSSRLKFLPAYLQQLFMESLGKNVTRSGGFVDYHTGRILWGDVGFIGQHAFFQLFHQGTSKTQLEFLIPKNEVSSFEDCRFNALSNALSQIKVLTHGAQNHNPHQHYSGNKPSTSISFPKVTAKILGQLLALYEHRVYVQASIWDINPFDQWGVELGKKIASEMIKEFKTFKSS